MKKCVKTSRTACHYPIANCRGGNCLNKDYPSKWGFPTCKGTNESKPKEDDKKKDNIKVPNHMRMAGVSELKAFNMQN